MKKFLVVLFFLGAAHPVFAATTPARQLSGRILLQVESRGEAWYVNPKTLQRQFLYKSQNAYQIMREEGVGISNANLKKVPIGFYQLSGVDTDGDGLIDDMEKAIGTNLSTVDSDNDGFTDKQEIQNGFNPLGAGKMASNPAFVQTSLGKIFLQVESHGEAWWLNPNDGKRYYLGRTEDAYQLMRAMGLGITSANLAKIPVSATLMNCVDDFHCLAVALKLDQLAKVNWSTNMDMFGAVFNTNTYIELTRNSTGYVYKATTKDIRVALSESGRQELISQGKTENEIQQIEAESNRTAQGIVGTISSCIFPTKNFLALYLEQAESGSFSSSVKLETGKTNVLNVVDGSKLGECTYSK